MQLGLPEKQDKSDIYIERDVRAELLEELAHLIMEAEESCDLPSVNWRTCGMIQSECEGVRTRGAVGVSFSVSPESPRTRSNKV